MKAAVRLLVRNRAQDCCEYCMAQAKFSHDPFSVEHIIPSSKGGSDQLDNLAWSCLGCNNFKFTSTEGYDMVTGKMATLFHPRKDMWSDHFQWNNDYTRIIGRTPEGRATVMKLQLNRPGLVNLRRILCVVNRHPPKFDIQE